MRSVLMLMFVLAGGVLPALSQDARTRIVIDGRPLAPDPPAILVSGHLLAPLRAAADRLGASVDWRPDSRTASVRKGPVRVDFSIGERRAVVDSRTMSLDAAPIVRDGRVFVPLRFLAEALSADVRWDARTRTAYVTSGPRLPSPPDAASMFVFFYVANQTGAEVRVRAWADGRELFDQRLPATATPAPGTVPPPPPYPVMELKVSIPRSSRTLEVQEDLVLRARRTFNIVGFDRSGAGFRVLITPDGISLSQDYRPIR